VTSVNELRSALAGTDLYARDIVELPILDTGEVAFAVQISSSEVHTMWRIARSVLHATGRWPVASGCWGGGSSNWRERVLKEDFFSRFYYKETPGTTDVSPRALLRAADSVDVDAFIEELGVRGETYFSLEEALEFEIPATERVCGVRPTEQELRKATLNGHLISTHRELDRWLMYWEAERGLPADRSIGRQPWYEHECTALIFLPVSEPWDTLAYLNWYGTSYPGAQYFIALGRRWRQRFGAELVAHFGTMLQCFVFRPPKTLDEAWQLAREHDLAAPCTLALPGISLRHHAVGLIGHDRWFLHERP